MPHQISVMVTELEWRDQWIVRGDTKSAEMAHVARQTVHGCAAMIPPARGSFGPV
jgi:hypothetical protein